MFEERFKANLLIELIDDCIPSLSFAHRDGSNLKKLALEKIKYEVRNHEHFQHIALDDELPQLVKVLLRKRGLIHFHAHTSSAERFLQLIHTPKYIAIATYIKKSLNIQKQPTLNYDDLSRYLKSKGINDESNKNEFYFSMDETKQITALQSGDLLLEKESDSLVALGQRIWRDAKGNQDFVHVGMASELYKNQNKDIIFEAMNGPGISSRVLASKMSGEHAIYHVWRIKHAYKNIADLAHEIASDLIAKHEKEGDAYGDYHFGIPNQLFLPHAKHAKAIEPILKQYAADYQSHQYIDKKTFFCSHFVMLCYEVARVICGYHESLFKRDFRHATPKNLSAGLLESYKYWEFKGVFHTNWRRAH